MNQLKFKVDPLLTSENVVDELRNDKLSLVKENSELREKMLNLSLTTSDLKTKVKDLEHERDSLITALKLQQQDIEQNRTTTQKRLAEWKTTSAPKNKDNQASATLNLHNSFDTLDDEQHPSVINLDISQQSDPDHQPTEDNNTSTGSNNGGTAYFETRTGLGLGPGLEENPDSRKTRTRTRKKFGLVFKKSRT